MSKKDLEKHIDLLMLRVEFLEHRNEFLEKRREKVEGAIKVLFECAKGAL